MIERARRAVAKHGVAGTARRALEHAKARAYTREEHIWYELDLEGERPRRELPESVELVEADAAQTDLIESLPTMPPSAAHQLRGHGGRLFFALEDGNPLFACWIHGRRAPAVAARGGWLELPPGVACLEDSVTAPEARGRGIAPGAWTELADRLTGEGVRTMITKVEVENVPSRRAVEKAGFQEVALMTMQRTAFRKRVGVQGFAPFAAEIARALSGSL